MTDFYNELVARVSAEASEAVSLPKLRGPVGKWDGDSWSWLWMNDLALETRVEIRLSIVPQVPDHSALLRSTYSCWLRSDPTIAVSAEVGSLLLAAIPERKDLLGLWMARATATAFQRALSCAETLTDRHNQQVTLAAELEADEQALLRQTGARP